MHAGVTILVIDWFDCQCGSYKYHLLVRKSHEAAVRLRTGGLVAAVVPQLPIAEGQRRPVVVQQLHRLHTTRRLPTLQLAH